MPAYEYVCADCGKEFSVYLSIKEFETHPLIKCPHCGSDKAARKYSGFFAKTGKKS